MRWRGIALQLLNNVITRVGIEIRPLARDFDNRFITKKHTHRMLAEVAERIGLFLQHEAIFPQRIHIDLEKEIREFYERFIRSRYRAIAGGSRFPNLLWLYVLRRTTGARLVVDSGTFTGASAWALSLGDDRPSVHSFDIQLKLLAQREERVTYHETDWSRAALPPFDGEMTLAYFDDHIDQVRRLMEAHQRGIRYLIFDDDVMPLAVPDNVGGSYALPKISFIDDPYLSDGEEIAWSHRGRRNVFKVDRAYLAKGDALIGKRQRLPDFSDITGIYQLPYKLIVLK